MALSELSGSTVMPDEDHARQQYPYVCWEHPNIYPGVMVPIWAVRLREAYSHVNLGAFGREMLKHVAKLFPPSNDAVTEERNREELAEAVDEDEYKALVAKHAQKARDEAEKERKGIEAVQAVIAVLQSYTGIISEQRVPGGADTSEPARSRLALQTLDLLEAAGMVYAPPSRQGRWKEGLPDDEKLRINALAHRDVERTRLLTAVRMPGRTH